MKDCDNLKPESRNPKPLPGLRNLMALFLVFALVALTFRCAAQSLPDETLAQIRFEQKLKSQVSPGLSFLDEQGSQVRLGDYFGRKPILLVLGYYECPMLCTLVLNGMVESAADMKWSIGREYDVINVSINPREGPTLAAAKKRAYVRRYGRSEAAQGWHFLTGNEESIRELADQAGFKFAYDPASKQYAHPSGLIVLTPAGKVSGYLFGVTFAPKDLAAALRTASANQTASPIQQLILLCFHYNPITGKYSSTIVAALRALGVATMLGFLGLIVSLVRRGRAAEARLKSIQAQAPMAPAPGSPEEMARETGAPAKPS